MLNLTLIQTSLYWQDREANLSLFTQLIDGLKEPTDIIILPEMFTTGFSMKPDEHAETIDGPTLAWMQKMASAKQCAITGSVMMQVNNRFVNRLLFVFPDGNYEHYDKRHLFRMAGENNAYHPGDRRIIIPFRGYQIFPVICYDLRFPVWLRRTREFNYDVMICVANWPERRVAHWKALLQARAVENQCFVAGVNRIGEDGHGIMHSGESALINAKGEVIKQEAHQPFVYSHTIDKAETDSYRQSFNVIDDADSFVLT